MNVLIDANVLISYLLTSEKTGTITTIIEDGFRGKYTMVLPSEVVSEVKKKVNGKKYLSEKIPKQTLQKFINALTKFAITPTIIRGSIPLIVRDRKDDYLLAYGQIEQCNYLVTGDEDLQVLKQVGTLQIVSPGDFFEILKQDK